MKKAIVTVAACAALLAATAFRAGAAAAVPSPCGATGVFYAPGLNPQGFTIGPSCLYHTVGVDTFTVPPYYQPSVTFTAIGAGDSSGEGQNHDTVGNNGYPGSAAGTLAVTADQVFDIRVGGMPSGSPPILGISGTEGTCDVGGFNGGGDAGSRFGACGGAGASDARPHGGGLTDRLIIGGGGGGSTFVIGVKGKGGDGGGESGTDGLAYDCALCATGDPGQGGNQFGGGASPGNASSAGFGFGGAGGVAVISDSPGFGGGAGGGGGYYGGGASGGSANPAGAGGGSGYVTPLATQPMLSRGVVPFLDINDPNFNDGYVIVTWGSEAPLTANVTLTADPASPVAAGSVVKLTATVTISTGAPPAGVVTLTDYSNGHGAANPSAPGGCPCSAIGQGYVDPDGNFTVTVNANALAHGPLHDIVATFQDSYQAIPDTSSSGLELDIAAGAQTITFTSTPPANATAFGPPYTVTATASSGLPVTFSIAVDSASATVCTITGSVVSFVAPGTCNILANQAGNASFNPAPQVFQSVTVAAASGTDQTIYFTSTPPSNPKPGDTYTVTASGGGSGNPVVFSTGGQCDFTWPNLVTFVQGGQCEIAADQNGGNGFSAAPEVAQVISIVEPLTVTFDTTPPSTPNVGGTYLVSAHAKYAAPTLSLDPSSSGCTLTGVQQTALTKVTSGTVSFTGSGTCIVTAKADSASPYFTPAEEQQIIPIAQTPTPTATFPTATATIPTVAPTNSPTSAPTFTSTALPTNTATTTPVESATPSMTPTPSATGTPTPADACAVAPRPACQSARRGSGISLNTVSQRMRGKWRGATPVSLSDFGNPVSGATAYHLCIYDTSAGPPTLAFSATVPPGGTCGTHPCWTQHSNRFLYTNTAATPDGIRHMALAAGGRTNAAIALSGRGPFLQMPVSPDGVLLLREFPEVIMQVQRSDGADCWEAVFMGPPIHDTRWVFADVIR